MFIRDIYSLTCVWSVCIHICPHACESVQPFVCVCMWWEWAYKEYWADGWRTFIRVLLFVATLRSSFLRFTTFNVFFFTLSLSLSLSVYLSIYYFISRFLHFYFLIFGIIIFLLFFVLYYLVCVCARACVCVCLRTRVCVCVSVRALL